MDQTHVATPVTKNIHAPVWPEHDFEKVIELAFRNRVIDTYEDAEKIFKKKRTHRVIVEGDDE